MLRVACWNCADGLGTKRALLDRLDADVLVVAEVRRADFDAIVPHFADGFYTPSASARGLATFLRVPGLRLRRFRVPGGAECYQWLEGDGVDILAAWVKAQGDYVRPARAVIGHFLRNSRKGARVVLGDLNLNPGFDRPGRTNGAGALVEALAARGLRSLYHQATGEPMGAERQATHHFTYNPARPFHIDFIFASRRLELTHFELGEAEAWMGRGRGDHVPLVAHLVQGSRLPGPSVRAAASPEPPAGMFEP